MPYLFERRKFGLTASSGSTSQKVPTSLFCPMPMSKGSRTNSTLAPERYSATKPLARFSSAPEIRPLHFTVEWALLFQSPADLLFELVSRRYEHNSTLVTTNRPFAEWREVFPNAACVVSLVDRLVHNAEVLAIEGDSYRLKEAQERAEQRARQRRKAKS